VNNLLLPKPLLSILIFVGFDFHFLQLLLLSLRPSAFVLGSTQKKRKEEGKEREAVRESKEEGDWKSSPDPPNQLIHVAMVTVLSLWYAFDARLRSHI
jgi:hypothetical protein